MENFWNLPGPDLVFNHCCSQKLMPLPLLYLQEKGQLLENVFADPKGFGIDPRCDFLSLPLAGF